MNAPRRDGAPAPPPSAPDLAAMLDSLSDAYCTVDRHWHIGYLNARAHALLAPATPERAGLTGSVLWNLVPPLCTDDARLVCQRAMEQRSATSTEFYCHRLASWFAVRAHPCGDGLALQWQDITRVKNDQQALVDGNTRLQLALSAGRLGDWRWDGASDRVTLGPRAAAMFGLPAESPLPWPALRAMLAPSDRARVRSAFLHAFASGAEVNLECRLAAADGAPRWIALVGRLDQSDPGGRRGVPGMTGVVQDISARKRAQDALRQSEELLRALANSIPQLAWMCEPDGNVTWLNERWFAYTGASPDEAVGWGWQQAVEPGVRPLVLQRWRAALATGDTFDMEYPLRAADGSYRWFLTRTIAVRERSGRVLRWFGTSTDVDEVKRAGQALREESHVLELLNATGSTLASTRELRALLRTATDAAAGIANARHAAFLYHGRGAHGRLFTLYTLSGGALAEFEHFGEARAQALFGAGLSADQPLRMDDLAHPAQPLAFAPYFGPSAGRPVLRSYLAVPVQGRAGELLGTMYFGHPEPRHFSERSERIVAGIAAQAAVAIDNTRLYEAARDAAHERKQLLDSEREARAEAERTSQMKDDFLATLSHELRTPLSAILGWAQMLRRGSRDEADRQRGLQTIERNARAQAQLIEDLLDMSRITSGKVLLDTQPLAPATVVDAAIDTVRPAAEARAIRIERRYDAATGLVSGDPARLQQVIWNLLSNAIKFTPRGGTVTVGVAPVNGSVQITVADTGIGIAPAFLDHVFERFRQADASTTRRHGGLGLGLAIVKQLVEQHGGTVRADSRGDNQGAVFTIELPAMRTAAAPGAATRAAAPAEAGPLDLSGCRVLVVDDDRDARELMARILSDCHAQVHTAADGPQALAIFDEHQPDLLISDLGMPQMDGFELLAEVRARGADRGGQVPAIALTAFARSEDRLSALEAGFSAHISKPVEPSELIAAVAGIVRPVRALLSAPRPAAARPPHD